jgi:hypothetical protein
MYFKFDKLISTIPLNVFSKLSNSNIDLKAFDMSYRLVDKDFFDFKDFNYVYDISDNKYHRLTKCKQGVVLDYFGDISNEKIKDIIVVKNSQIISLDKDFSLNRDDIKFLGRYGAWNRRWKTETVIEETYNE